ncbi:MAG TPA: type II secretion system F family protein [Thermoleophilaceae bacterium]
MLDALLAFAAAGLGTAGAGLLVPAGARHGRNARLLRVAARVGRAARPLRRLAVPPDLRKRVSAAGLPPGLGIQEIMAAKVGAALLAAPLGAMLGAVAPGRLGAALTVAAPVAGFLAPDRWLARRAAARARSARQELPAMLDLLRVTVHAGLPLTQALGEVARRSTGVVAAEWSTVARRVRLGVPMREALGTMAETLPIPETLALVAAVERSLKHGAPLADTLAAQAREARAARARAIREEAAKAGPKIQLVVALLLVPSVLLLVAAALGAALLGSGAGLG